jgi:hypothetical protein
MLTLSFLLLAVISMANAVTTSGDTRILSLLDIVESDSASALEEMLDNSPGPTYIKPDLSNVNLLKVTIIDGKDDSVVTYMEMPTNAHAAAYRKALYAEIDSESEVETKN